MNVYRTISTVLEAISSPARLQILLAIGRSEACVCHLEALLGLRQAYISQQLMLLREKGIITTRRDGKYIYYRLEQEEILDLIRLAARLAGLDDSALMIQEHSVCECPQCASGER